MTYCYPSSFLIPNLRFSIYKTIQKQLTSDLQIVGIYSFHHPALKRPKWFSELLETYTLLHTHCISLINLWRYRKFITTFYFSITLLETSLPWIMFSYIVFSSVAACIFYVVTHFLQHSPISSKVQLMYLVWFKIGMMDANQ